MQLIELGAEGTEAGGGREKLTALQFRGGKCLD